MKKIIIISFLSIVVCFITRIITDRLSNDVIHKMKSLSLENEESFRENFNEKIYPFVLFFENHKNEVVNYSPKEKEYYLSEAKKSLAILQYFNAATSKQVYQTKTMEKLQDAYSVVLEYDTFILSEVFDGHDAPISRAFRIIMQFGYQNGWTEYTTFIDMINDIHTILDKQ